MAEIIELEHEVIVATVEETSGAATGTKVVSNHSVSGANQHTIGAITGLEDRLQTIEALKDTIGVKRVGHADYYQWGEEATDVNPLTWGYFVRLDNNGRIHKCTAETTVIPESALRLETKPIENIDAWDEASKNPNMIYYVNEETYYNYQGDEWVPYTNLDDITYDNMVIKYVYAGNITTADMDKYYVVGKLAPYDIYAYDGVQYVKKATYSYEDGVVSRTCNAIDVFGVTVNEAGFVGAHTQDDTYALVATTGLVDVLCRSGVVEGDYVYPTVGGIADKADSTYGYSVTKIWSDGTNSYARIVLAHSIELSKSIAKNIDYLLTEAQRLDGNITTFGNTAEAALKRAEELTEAAQQSANTSSQVAQDATNAAVDAQKSAADAWGVAEQVIPSAQQAVADAKAAQESALALRDDTIASANETAAQIATEKSNETLNTVRALEYNLDKYTIGQYSQAYGLTFAQAKAILPVGTTFIPMDEDPLATDARQEYREVYAGGEDPDVEQVFTVGYAYVWTNDGWLVDASHPTVLITREFTEQTEGDYWFVVKEYEGTEYNGGSLYRWQEGGWKEVAIRKENTMNRTIAHLCHEDDTIRQSVSSVEGKVAAVETKVTETDARVGLVASVPTGIQAQPGNYNEETESLDVIADKATLDTEWTDKAVVGKYYVVGNKLPYEVYEWDGSGFVLKDTVTYDGTNLYKANVASIFTTANEEGGNISLNADRIQFTSRAFNIFASDGDGNILKDAEGNSLVNFAVDNAGNVDLRGRVTATSGQIGNLTVGTDGSLTCTKVQTDEEGVEVITTTFNLDADGNASFEGNGVFSGTVIATSGSIGGCEIQDGTLKVSSANIDTLEASKVMVTGTQSIMTAIENTLIDSKTYYALSDSVTTEPIQDSEKPETIWNTVAPQYQEGMYMWQKIVNTYNCAPAEDEEADEDGHKIVTTITCIAGASGKGIKDVISYYLATNLAEGVTTTTEGWTQSVQYTSSDNKFLWKYEDILYTDDSSKPTTPCIVGMFGESVVYKYYLSNSNIPPKYVDTNGDNVINADDGWYDAPQGVSKDHPYEYVVQVMGMSTTNPALWAKYGFDGGVLQQTVQYLVSKSITPRPDSTDEGWKDDFPSYDQNGGEHKWTGENYVWKKIVTSYDVLDESVEIILLSTIETANILAEQDGKSLAQWCEGKNITLIDGSSIVTGSITAEQLSAEVITAKTIVGALNDNQEEELIIDSDLLTVKGKILATSGDINGLKLGTSDDGTMTGIQLDNFSLLSREDGTSRIAFNNNVGAGFVTYDFAPVAGSTDLSVVRCIMYSPSLGLELNADGTSRMPFAKFIEIFKIQENGAEWTRLDHPLILDSVGYYYIKVEYTPVDGGADDFYTVELSYDGSQNNKSFDVSTSDITITYQYTTLDGQALNAQNLKTVDICSQADDGTKISLAFFPEKPAVYNFYMGTVYQNFNGEQFIVNVGVKDENGVGVKPMQPISSTMIYSLNNGEKQTAPFTIESRLGFDQIAIPSPSGLCTEEITDVSFYPSQVAISRPNIGVSGNIIPMTPELYTLGLNEYKWADVWSKNGVNETSDRNEKNTIQPLGDQYSELFDLLQPVSYKFNDNTSDRTHTGLIAQDVESSLHQAGLTTKDFAAVCSWDKGDGEKGYSIRYTELIALCINEIQKLKKEIKELKDK